MAEIAARRRLAARRQPEPVGGDRAAHRPHAADRPAAGPGRVPRARLHLQHRTWASRCAPTARTRGSGSGSPAPRCPTRRCSSSAPGSGSSPGRLAHPEFMELVYERLVANGIIAVRACSTRCTTWTRARVAPRGWPKQAGGDRDHRGADVHDQRRARRRLLRRARRAARGVARRRPRLHQGPGRPADAGARPDADPGGAGGARRQAAGAALALHDRAGPADLPGRRRTSACRSLQTGCGPLADGTSLPDAQRVVANLRELGHTVDVDDRLLGLSPRVLQPAGRGRGAARRARRSDFDAAFLRHQIAGGVLTTTAAPARRARARAPLRRGDRGGEPGPRRARLPDHGHAVPADRHHAGAVSTCMGRALRERARPGRSATCWAASAGRRRRSSRTCATGSWTGRGPGRSPAEPPPLSPAELRRRFRAGSRTRSSCCGSPCPRSRSTRCSPPARRRGTTTPELAAGAAAAARARLAAAASATSSSDKPGLRLSLRRGLRVRPWLTWSVRGSAATARGFVFDMDGTLVLGDRTNNGLRPLPGALEITRWAARARAAVRGVHQRDQPRRPGRPTRGSCGTGPAAGRGDADPGQQRGPGPAPAARPPAGHAAGRPRDGRAAGGGRDRALPPLRGTPADAVLAGWFRRSSPWRRWRRRCQAVVGGGRATTALRSRRSSRVRRAGPWARRGRSAPSSQTSPAAG